MSQIELITDPPINGKYTPTPANLTNITTVNPQVLKYTKIGNYVSVFGYIAVQPTAAGVASFEIDLPIPSNLSNIDVGGGAIGRFQSFNGVAEATNDTVKLITEATDITLQVYSLNFSYEVN